MDEPSMPSSSSSSTFPLPLVRDIPVDVERPIQPVAPELGSPAHASHDQLPVPPNGVVVHRRCPRILIVLGIIVAIILVILFVTIFAIRKKTKRMHECTISFSVLKNGKSDFKTVSEAIDASPSNYPSKICIFIGEGEYHEMVKIDANKNNIILMGEGVDRTMITSNASSGEIHVDYWRNATLWVIGVGFTAQDLTIVNIARDGAAVDNWSPYSVFYRCNLRGANMTLFMKGNNQFYRDCNLYGKTYLVTGYIYSFFQRCTFIIDGVYDDEEVVFVGQDRQSITDRSGSIFHLCAFKTVDNSTKRVQRVFLGSPLGDAARIIVMQSSLDASVTDYLTDSSAANTSIYFATFGNFWPGAATITSSPYVHELQGENAESEFSLRAFLKGETWIPPEVEMDLDVTK